MTITKELPCRLLHRQGIGGVGSLQPVPQNILRMTGVSGNYISTPDTPANSVIGDIDIRAKVSLDKWMPSTSMSLVSKWPAAGNRAWTFLVDSTTGLLRFAWSADGTAVTGNKTSSVAPTVVDGATLWVRVTLLASTGQATFYTSADGLTWSQLGSLPSATGATSIFDSTATLNIGAEQSTTTLFAGYIYYAEVRSGINGPVVAAFDPSTAGVTGDRTPSTLTTISKADSVYLPGTTGNYISTPDSAANSVTGDIDIRAHVSADDWTPVAIMQIVNKEVPSVQRSYGLRLDTTGKLLIRYCIDGTNALQQISSVATGFTDGTTHWVRVTRTVADSILFYTSEDGVIWTQLGTTISGVNVGNLFDSTSPIEIGVRSAVNDPFAGKVYYAEVRNGINGPIVAQFDAAGTSVTAVQTPSFKQNIDGSMWTINGVAWRWSIPNGQSSTGALRLAGVVGTEQARVSTPDAADISITGDMDVRIQVALDDWTPASPTTLISKWDSSTQRTFVFYQDTLKLTLGYSLDGTAQLFAVCSANTPMADGSVKWVRFTRNATTGDVIFYTSDDNITYVQLGTTQAGTAGALFDGTSALNIGADNTSGGRQANEYLFRAEVYNGIAGTLVAWFDTAAIPIATNRTPTTIVQSGRTWTLNGPLWSWISLFNVPVWTINGTNWWWAQEGRTPYQNGITLDPQYVRFDGTTGNYASTPDSAGLSVTGDIDLRVKVALDNWTPATNQTILAKYDTGSSQRSYRLFVSGPTGAISFAFSTDGITPSTAISSWIPAYAPGTTKWIRVTRATATGIITFYDSDDGVTWTQRTAPTQATGAIFDSTAPATVGAFLVGGVSSEHIAGKVYYAEIRNGIAGTRVGGFRPQNTQVTAVRTPSTALQGVNAELWAMTGSAWSYSVFPMPIITTPDSAALSIVGDIDLRAKVTMPDNHNGPLVVIGKRASASGGYQLRFTSDQRVELSWGDGTVTQFRNGSTAPPFSFGSTLWIRATLDVDNGAAGHTSTFYYSSDGVTWTQISQAITAGITQIGDFTDNLQIGSTPGSGFFYGTIYYAEVRNGIAGTVVGVFDPNAVKPTDDELPTTIPSRTGEVYTITGSGWHWGAAA